MKLIVQIPCLNEEATLARTIADIPRRISGVDAVEVLVVDDGSSDRTVEVARAAGADHIVCNKRNVGLAWSFRRGLDAALAAGADIIVNTDGDNQYAGSDIPKLIAPILRGEADIVVGDRETHNIEHFSPLKKFLQHAGSAVVRRLSGVNVPDAVCGFRALSRDAALQLNIVSKFSYTTEMIIQAGKRRISVTSVPITTNDVARSSRLFRSIPQFVALTVGTMMRTYAMYQPLRTFFYIGAVLFVIGAIPMVRFLYFFAIGDGAGHVQSLVIGGAFLIMGFVAWMIGLLADLTAVNRQLLEMLLNAHRREGSGDDR